MNTLIEKVISTSQIGAGVNNGGLLAPEQANTFIDYMWNATVLGSQVRTIKMRANEQWIDRIAVGERIVRLATEASADGVNVGVAFTKVSLTTEKLRVDWELSSESLEDNLEGDALEDHIARLIATQAANDLEDLAINGNVANTTDPTYKAFDGWRRRLYAGANVVDGGADELDRGTFNKALKAMPRNFRAGGRGKFKFFSSAGLIQDYLFDAVLADTGTYQRTERGAEAAQNADNVGFANAGWTPAAPFGVSLQEVPLFPEYEVSGKTCSDVWLTDPKNLLWGVKREIQVYREFKPRKDTVEYTLYTRVGAAIENEAAAVLVKSVALKDS